MAAVSAAGGGGGDVILASLVLQRGYEIPFFNSAFY
jgi:hypothetical protein